MTTEDPRQCWGTPDDFFNVVDAEFGFDIDVAATGQNTKCGRWISPEKDALNVLWFDFLRSTPTVSAWCNPGFKNMRPWVERAYEQTQEVIGSVACVLGPLGDGLWLVDYCHRNATEIRILTPRINFVPAPGVEMSRNMKPNVLVVFRKKANNQPAIWWPWSWKGDA